jgi:hypothetical protein
MNGLPFKTLLLAMLLQGYLIEGKPKQDKLLIAHLKQVKRIPLPLIAMGTVLVSQLRLSCYIVISIFFDVGWSLLARVCIGAQS